VEHYAVVVQRKHALFERKQRKHRLVVSLRDAYARRMGQITQRATNYTARSNIDTAQIFLHANGQRPNRAMIRQRSRRRQRRGEPHTEHGLGVLLASMKRDRRKSLLAYRKHVTFKRKHTLSVVLQLLETVGVRGRMFRHRFLVIWTHRFWVPGKVTR